MVQVLNLKLNHFFKISADYSDLLGILLSLFRQAPQILLLLKTTTSSELEQNVHWGSYFLRTTFSPSVKISKESLGAISRCLRNSIGRTILPSSSTFLTIPVDFKNLTRPLQTNFGFWE